MRMIQGIVDTFLKRGEGHSMAPPSMPGFRAVLPAQDTDEFEEQEDVQDLLGECFVLNYVDAKQEESVRRIALHHVYKKDDKYYLRAFCFERSAPRLFRADRIKMLTDLVTGEVIEPPNITRWLDDVATPQSHEDATIDAIQQLRPGILILLFLARCDGHFHPSEFQVLLEYIDAGCGSNCVDENTAKKQLDRLQPDPASYAVALSNLAGSDPAELRRIARFARRLIDADGAISPEEHRFAEAITRFVEP